jgi:MarR family transcriptional regulator, 2-MHQ and catechol-resistance regulon repressor
MSGRWIVESTAQDSAARRLHRALQELLRALQLRDRDRICCHDVSVSQCYALDALARRGPLTLNELAAELFLDKSTTSRVADALEGKGYLERRTHPRDGRAVLLETTEKGRVLCRRIEAELLKEVEVLLAEIEPEAREAAVRLVSGLSRAAADRVEASAGCCRLR